MQILPKKTILLFYNFLLFVIIVFYKLKDVDNSGQLERDISCYGSTDLYLNEMDDTFTDSESKIFFLETSCNGGLNSRQACSVESAARINPNWTIFVIFAGSMNLNNYENSRILTALLSMRNIKFLRLNVTSFVYGTLLERFYIEDYMIKRSSAPVVHTSDLLRLLILNKYGGIYLDLDVIVTKSFDDLPKNFVAKQNEVDVASGVLAFTKNGIGKLFTSTALKLISKEFDPDGWEENGPGIIMKCLVKICNFRFTNTICDGIRIFDSKYFFPINYGGYQMYYLPQNFTIDDSEAYTHHIWNHLLNKSLIHKKSLLSKLAQKYCPTMFGSHQSNTSVFIFKDIS